MTNSPFLINNASDPVAVAGQAEPDRQDFTFLACAAQGNGVLYGCAASAAAPGTSLVVNVAAGAISCQSLQTCAAVTAGTVTLAAGSAIGPRYDLITVSSTGVIGVIGGPAAATEPHFPNLSGDQIPVAAVYVPQNATSIPAAVNVQDKRCFLNPVGLTVITTELAVNGPLSWTNAIPDIGSGFPHIGLHIDAFLRSSDAVQQPTLYVAVGSATGPDTTAANYFGQTLSANGTTSSIATVGGTTAKGVNIGIGSGDSDQAGRYSPVTIDLPHYAVTANNAARIGEFFTRVGGAGAVSSWFVTEYCLWLSANSVQSLSFASSSTTNNFKAGSSVVVKFV